MDAFQRTDLLKKVLRYPLQKAVETFLLFSANGSLCAIYLHFILHVDPNVAAFYFVAFSSISYIFAMVTLCFSETFCNNIATRIVAQGVSVGNGQRNFGMSLRLSFLLFVMLPIMFSQLFLSIAVRLSQIPVAIHLNGTLAEKNLSSIELSGLMLRQKIPLPNPFMLILFVALANIAGIFILIFLYYSRNHHYVRLMRETLGSIESDDLRTSDLFPVNLSTENSYTLHLINKTILWIDSIMRRNAENNALINASSQKLSDLSRETDENLKAQIINVEKILSAMQSINFISRQVEKKINEVVNVAAKTLSNVEFIFSDMSENMDKMHEITESNRSSIEHMEDLLHKIGAIQNVVNIIDTVAENTKTIAFNADLEANKLDTKYLNFNEVAEEIRALADSTFELTKKVRIQIKEIIGASGALILTGNDCMKKTNEGNEICTRLENRFEEIRSSADETVLNSSSIKTTIGEQGETFKQILETLTEIKTSLSNFSSVSSHISELILKLKDSSSHILALNQEYAQITNPAAEENTND